MLRFLLLLGGCAVTQLTPGQRMELIEQLEHSSALAKKCGLGKSEMRVRFVALPDGSIAEPVVTLGPNGTPQQTACVMEKLTKTKLSPHDKTIIVRTERNLPFTRHTDAKLAADQNGLPQDHIDSVVHAALPAQRACYKGAHGNVTVFFLVDPKGKVSDVLVESTLNAPDVDWCLLDAFKTLEFKKPSDGGYVEVAWPIRIP